MGTVRIEFVPVQKFGLGLFGFDHVQLVFEDESDLLDKQDYWYVMEGVQDGLVSGTLGALGENGRTTLGVANGAFGDDLVDKIGTPDTRGSRVVTTGDNALALWDQMANYASEIEAQRLPYIPASLPFVPSPTINSTSFVASLLWSVGVDIHSVLPFGLGLSPGGSTLIGTTGSDNMSATETFNTIVGGGGDDTLHGSDATLFPDKLYGGTGDDTFYWSPGPNIIDGGLPRLAYAEDGMDTVNYSGVGTAHIEANRFAIEHKVADYTVTFANGNDQLFSIEQIRWTPDSDVITVGDGVDLLEKPLQIDLEDNGTGHGDELDFTGSSKPLLINVVDDQYTSIQTLSNAGEDAGIWANSLEWVDGSRGNDLIFAGPTMRGADGGDGDDLLDARLSSAFGATGDNGHDIELYGGKGNDTLVAGGGLTFASGGEGFDRYVLSTMSTSESPVDITLTIDDEDGEGGIYVPIDFFKEERGDFDGSALFQLTGAPFAITDNDPISYFLWSTEPHDQVHGYIDFVGQITYAMDGDDLVITLDQGTVQQDTSSGPDGPETDTIVISQGYSETKIHIKDWSDGDLGISFPLTFDGAVANEYPSFYDYPGLKEVMQQQTAQSLFSDPLEARPDGHLPLELASNAPASFATTLTMSPDEGTDGDDMIVAGAGGPFTLSGHAGNDDITGSDGGDIIDGGTGGDTMRGGRGNDTYYVDSADDAVIENAHEGFDRVIAGIDYALGENVENLTLTGSAVTGTGNDARNTLEGNDLDNVLVGGAGDDTLAGNLGNDWLEGGTGSDGYVYELGDGRDIIVEAAGSDDRDVLVLAGAITENDFNFTRDAGALDDLVMRFNDGGSITIKDYFVGNGAGIEEIDFASGLRWTDDDIAARAAEAPISTNTAPVAKDDAFIAASDGPFTVPFAALIDNDGDFDGDALTLLSVVNAAGGSAQADASGNVVVTPSNADALVSFDYTVTDGHGGTATATFRLQFTPSLNQNAAPVIVSAGIEAAVEDQVTHGAIVVSDADADVLSYAVKEGAGPTKGTVSIAADGTFTYTPFADVNGEDHFTLTATDGKSAPVEQAFDVDIAPVNDAPTAANDSGFAVEAGQTVRITAAALLANDGDIDGDTLTIAELGGATRGSVAQDSDGDILFTADADATGTASFTYQVTDGHGGTASAVASIDVSASPSANHAPVIVAALLSPVIGNHAAAGLVVAIDLDGDHLTYGVKSGAGPHKGTVNFEANGAFHYAPLANVSGTDEFTVTVSDGHATREAVVAATIIPIGGALLPDGHRGIDTALASIAAAGPHPISGTLGRDTLLGTDGEDLIRGLAGADTFVFSPAGGHDEIADFEAGHCLLPQHDLIDLRAFHFGSYAVMLAHLSQDGHDTLITPDTGTEIRLDHVDRIHLTAGHFLL